MRGVVLGLFVLQSLLGNLDAADKTWVGGVSSNWFEPGNWNPAGVPAPTESIAVTNFTSIVITDNVALASLELRRAMLVVSNQLTVTNLLLADGARLNAWLTRPNPVTNPPAGSGIVEIPVGGRVQIADSDASAFSMEGTRLNLRGSGWCTNRSGALLFFRSEFNVFGILNLGNQFSFDGANGPPAGSLTIYGRLERSRGTDVTFPSVGLTNRGEIMVESGTMNIGNGASSGAFNTSFGATQSFAGNFQWQSGGSFTGPGTVRLARGTFDCGTNDLLIPNLHWDTPGMALQGTNIITVNEASWDVANATGRISCSLSRISRRRNTPSAPCSLRRVSWSCILQPMRGEQILSTYRAI